MRGSGHVPHHHEEVRFQLMDGKAKPEGLTQNSFGQKLPNIDPAYHLDRIIIGWRQEGCGVLAHSAKKG